MPGFDETGPWGGGPMTGGGRGYCNPGRVGTGSRYGPGYGQGSGRGRGFRRGCGPGAGRGRGYGSPRFRGSWEVYGSPNPADEAMRLRDEADALKNELEALKSRIEDLESRGPQTP